MAGSGELPAAPRDSSREREAYFLDYARQIRAVTTLPLMLTGGMRTRATMDAVLGDVAADGPPARSGVSDAAVRTLARSPHLPALRRITRGQEHRAYTDGAREGPETTPIHRDDGRVVESIIHHAIWP